MMLMRTAKSCRSDAPMPASSLREEVQTTVSNKPGHRGEREVSRKTIARGMPGLLRCTCGDYARVLYFISHARLRVHWAPGIPCALCFQRGETFHAPLGRIAPRDGETVSGFYVIARSAATKQSSLLCCRAGYGLLRGACHRARIRATRWLAMTALAPEWGCFENSRPNTPAPDRRRFQAARRLQGARSGARHISISRRDRYRRRCAASARFLDASRTGCRPEAAHR